MSEGRVMRERPELENMSGADDLAPDLVCPSLLHAAELHHHLDPGVDAGAADAAAAVLGLHAERRSTAARGLC
eukprot:1158993-Pelagomonas_calceolata.AAC.5